MSEVQIVITSDQAGSGLAAEGGGPLGGGLFLANRFEAKVFDPEIPYELTMTVAVSGGRLACESLTVDQVPNGPAVIGTVLRSLVIDSYLSRVREQLGEHKGAILVRKVTERTSTTVASRGVTSTEWAQFDQSQRRTGPVKASDVAELYRRARASADPAVYRAPTAAVARKLGIGRSYAARLVSRARKEGLLGPAIRGRSGEQTAQR
ncbi:MAG: hypothetical protein DLM61_01600 [Pseudonocardiales bacterium]|nr:MAG: hypothetical protein DLM61_01600 [Pseudonocardiales bacterium]